MRPRATPIMLAAAALITLSGCTFSAEQTVQKPYDPSDGFGGSVGDIAIRNALLITEDGEDASLSINFINRGNQNVTLVASWETAAGAQVSRNIYLSSGTARTYGEASNQIVLHDIDAELGALYPVYFQYGDVEGLGLEVPVLDGTLDEYSELVPAASASESQSQ